MVLPTTAFGEERVTFTNTERRIQLAEQVIEPLPGTTPAWEQLTRGGASAWAPIGSMNRRREVMEEIGQAVPFYSGANYENLAREYGRQWPCTKDRPLGTRFLFAERAGRRNGGSSLCPSPKPAARPAQFQRTYPLTLVFGHSLYYWNQNVLIQHSETLKREYRILLLDYPEGFVEMNPDDAKRAWHPRRQEDPAARGERFGGGDRAGHARSAQRGGFRAVLRAPGAAADSRLDGERRPAGPGARGKGGA